MFKGTTVASPLLRIVLSLVRRSGKEPLSARVRRGRSGAHTLLHLIFMSETKFPFESVLYIVFLKKPARREKIARAASRKIRK